LSIIICLSFMFQYSLDTWLAFGVSLVIGILIYFFYGYRHSEAK
ncbi:amino acid permease C-terminal domain-containing protein, partial [Streptococcus suis]